ncbi:DUF4145 domain-containing protein [Sinorhizobium meliloti]|uniref:DUF4145 domain-containing protein n=1 Tax=Rhizobium meliloti TaxID=382 RepID=UPI000FDB41DD|nr:DUF4145 domain-containing protein [Sinorhizobium meliloti]RVG28646.1 DUF4145 domain-containing protein [Sinorhizobium meliloti]
MDREPFDKSWILIPKFRCPKCKSGTLLQHGNIVAEETEYSKREFNLDDWEPEWMTVRFVMLLKCDTPSCGEVITVAGDRRVETFDDWDSHQQHVVEVYYPHTVVPGPHVFPISPNLSETCKHHLAKAFELMWTDAAASANRLRIFVERLMDQYQIPTEGPSDKDPTKIVEWKLFKRIDELEKQHPGHKDAFTALRHVGNEASHMGQAKRETLLDCFEILEDALNDLVDSKKQKISQLTQSLIASKGKK